MEPKAFHATNDVCYMSAVSCRLPSLVKLIHNLCFCPHSIGLSLDQYQNRCPNQLEEQTYDAKAHDMWCVGHILFELVTGTKLYSVEDTFMKEGGLEALLEGDLKSYLREVGLLNCFKTRPFAVLQGLLAVDENKRLTAAQVTEHPWFSNYHRRYNKSMEMRISMFCSLSKFTFPQYFCLYTDTDALKWQNAAEDLLENFPFYPQKFWMNCEKRILWRISDQNVRFVYALYVISGFNDFSQDTKTRETCNILISTRVVARLSSICSMSGKTKNSTEHNRQCTRTVNL